MTIDNITVADLRVAFDRSGLTYRDAAIACDCTIKDICDFFNDRLFTGDLFCSLCRLVRRTLAGQVNSSFPCNHTPAGDTAAPDLPHEDAGQSSAGAPKQQITKKGEVHDYHKGMPA